MKDMYNKGGESADDKRYRIQMQKRGSFNKGGEISDVDKFLKLDADLKEAEARYADDPEALESVAKHREQIENSFSPETLSEAYQKMDAESEDRDGKMEGGMMKYNEGSMLIAPEMNLETEEVIPEDTYDNIPEDEADEAKESQLPDDEMEEDYTDYVLEQSLDPEEQEYLISVLETDERLSSIFDKVMDVAGEFSGEGEVDVEGLGTGVSDSIPARLSDGEFVFTKKATDHMGADQLQTMMDEAEMAYDGGLMKKAFGGMVDDAPSDKRGKSSYTTTEDEEIKKQMIDSNRMPSVR